MFFINFIFPIIFLFANNIFKVFKLNNNFGKSILCIVTIKFFDASINFLTLLHISFLLLPYNQGNYIYPEGFDPETNEWKPGYEEQQAAWEQQYAEAQARWEAHKRQVAEAAEAERQAATTAGTGYASTSTEPVEI